MKLALVIGVLLAYCSVSISAGEASDVAGGAVSGASFTVVSFNAEWLFDGIDESYSNAPQSPQIADEHLRDVAELLQTYNADFIAIQEIENRDMLVRLAALLGGDYEGVFIEGDAPTGQDVAALSRYPVAASGRTDEWVSFPIDGSELSCMSGSVNVPQNVWVNLEVNGTPLTIINAHLLAYTDRCDRAVQREAQALALTRLARDVALDQGRQLILLGDLNDYDTAVPDSSGSVPLSSTLGILKDVDPSVAGNELVNTTVLLPQEDRYTAWWDKDMDGVDDGGDERTQIDFILTDSSLFGRITDVMIDHCFPAGAVSDHWPIVVKFDLRQAAYGEAGDGLTEAYVEDTYLIDRFADSDLRNELGFSWISHAWGSGSLSAPLHVGHDEYGTCLVLNSGGAGEVGTSSDLGVMDASNFSGAFAVLTASRAFVLGLNLQGVDSSWPAGHSDVYATYEIGRTELPTVIEMPFDDLAAESWKSRECPDCSMELNLSKLTTIGIEIASGSPDTELRIYEVGFYRNGDNGIPVPTAAAQPIMATPGVDGYAVILSLNDYPGDFEDIMIDHIDRDRIINVLCSAGWKEDDMYVVLDHDVTSEAVEDSMNWVLERVTEEDLVFVFVTSHYSYLKHVAEFDTAFPSLWEQIPTARKVLVMNVCNAGELTTTAMYGRHVPEESLENPESKPTPGISISSSGYNEPSVTSSIEEDLPIIGGVMTYYLCEALADSSLDIDNDTYVSVEEAFAGMYPRTRDYYRYSASLLLERPELPEAVRQAILNDIASDNFAHPGLIDAFPGNLILDLRYYADTSKE